MSMMRDKININKFNKNDEKLIKELLDLMHVFKLDYTNTFVDIENNDIQKHDFMKEWYEKLKERRKLNAEQEERSPNWIDKKLAKLATSIGRVDRLKD